MQMENVNVFRRQLSVKDLFLPARRYANAGTSYGPVSVTSRCSIEVVGLIELVFGLQATFDQSCTVF